MFYTNCVVCATEQKVDEYPNRDKCQVVGCCIKCEHCEEVKKAASKSTKASCKNCGESLSSTYYVGLKEYSGFCYNCGRYMDKLERERRLAHIHESLGKARSAKARSVVDLVLQKHQIQSPYRTQKEVLVYPISNDTEVQTFFSDMQKSNRNVFARPAPLTPVHGFFDSRVVSDFWQVRKLAHEIWTKKAKDEILEIILMPEIANARFSGIVTPNSITIGRGNDGATNGKTAITIRTPQDCVSKIVSDSLREKYTKEGESTFVEVVVNNSDTPQVVQIRSGNEPASGGNDFIPYDVTVRTVHEVTDKTDLVAWQKLVATFEKGDVIHAQSLACHGAVHGVLHNIPVITTFAPEIGQELIGGKITPVNYNRVRSLLFDLFLQRQNYVSELPLYGWKSLHLLGANMQAGGEEILAFSLFYTLMGGLAACLGEYGHAQGDVKKEFRRSSHSRNDVFVRCFSDKKKALQNIFIAWEAFLDSSRWRSKSFGGPRWAECAEHTARLANRIGKLIKDSSDTTLKNAVESANELAHCMHNGGLLFNKFGQVDSNGDEEENLNENIADIFSRHHVLNTLMRLKENNSSDEEISELAERFNSAFLKTLLRRLPKRLLNYAEEEKKRQEKLSLEKRKKEKEIKEQVKFSLDWLLDNGQFKLTTYKDTWNGDLLPNYAWLEINANGTKIANIYSTEVSGKNPPLLNPVFVEGVELQKPQIALTRNTRISVNVDYDGNICGSVHGYFKVAYEDIPPFELKVALSTTSLIHNQQKAAQKGAKG